MTRRITHGPLLAAVLLPLLHCSSPGTGTDAPSFTPPSAGVLRQVLADAPDHEPFLPGYAKDPTDYVDLARQEPERPLIDDGRGRVVTDSAGAWRETGRARGSYFCLRVHTPAFNVPHLVLVEYPDDRERAMAFGLTEPSSGVPPPHVQTGVRTGGDAPCTGRMRLHAFFAWPRSEWPMLYCANMRNGTPAAAARIWVYRLSAAPPVPEVVEPDSTRVRRIGPYIGDYRTALARYGGGTEAGNNLTGHLAMLGCNLAAVTTAGPTGIPCRTGYFGGSGDGIDTLLLLCARHGIDLVPVFEPGRNALNKDAVGGVQPADRWLNALMDFVRSYDTRSALHGIALGGTDVPGSTAGIRADDAQDALNAALAARGLPVTQYVFMHPGPLPPVSAAVYAWERGTRPFGEYLARQVRTGFDSTGLSPARFRYREGVIPVRMRPAPGADAFPYLGAPYDRAREYGCLRAGVPDKTPAAAIVTATTELQPLCLDPADGRSWFAVNGTEPCMCGGGRNALRPPALALAAADANDLFIDAPALLTTDGGSALRTFIRAFRSLPARPFSTLTKGHDPVVARILYRRGRTYFYFVNTLPEPVGIKVRIGDFRTIPYWVTEHPFNIKYNQLTTTLEPYELAVFHANGGFDVHSVRCVPPAAATAVVRARLDAFRDLLRRAERAGVPLPRRYASLHKRAARAFARRRYAAADRMLPGTLADALRLRLEQHADKPVRHCPRAVERIRIDGRLDDWTGTALSSAIMREEQLAPGRDAPNHWRGTDDYRASFRLLHADGMLLLGADITDDEVVMGERILVSLADSTYRGTGDGMRYDYTETVFCAPVESDSLVIDLKGGGRACTRRTQAGYTVEARIPLAAAGIDAVPGTAFGCVLAFCDADRTRPERCGADAPDNLFLWPASAGRYPSADDPRGALEIILDE